MGTDLRPGVLADLLNLLGVLNAELTGGLDSTLLPLGFRELATGQLFQQLGMVVPRSSARIRSRLRTSSLVLMLVGLLRPVILPPVEPPGQYPRADGTARPL
ncbi:hypothetical protein ACWDBO_49960 [Streptomyces mirabilis]|uniref:hypothetical protein n=1 Tax=Streptomyces mirabilis TaxID=68239 RepID=UPI003328E91D